MPLHRAVIWYLAFAATGLAGCKTTEVPGSSVYEVLPGTWGLRQSKRYGCDVNPHVIRFSEDRKEITLAYALPADADAGEPAIIRLQVLSDSPRLRVFRHGERRRIPSTNELVVWDLVMVSPDEHCWHRPDRNPGSCTRRVVRCPAG